MNTYLKLASTKTSSNCNCISPFYINNITGINPNTKREYSSEDKDILKTALYRISNAKGCSVSVCCDPDDPTSMPDATFTKQFIQTYPKIMPMYNGSNLTSIKLSTTANVKQSGWIDPPTYMICKITKATIISTSDPTIKLATNLVNDCFTDQCNQAETITMNTLLNNTKTDMTYTYIDDARVTQAIREDNITYVKQYIRQYRKVDISLTNDDYNNRMIHIASESKSKNNEMLNMLIALKSNLNIKNKLKETPIHFAVRSRNIDNIDALLAQGVDLSIANNKGETAMFYAMKTGDMRVINMIYNGGSGVLGVDSKGNNLIHYCIENCPSYADVDSNTHNIGDTSIVANSKSKIINFLIEHGVSTEQKNANGISPLELVGKNINKQINAECALGKAKDTAVINEAFFNIKPIREAFTNSTGGATSLDLSKTTIEHNSLLEIQTILFNNIIKNNPKKFRGYIGVDDIPKGSPIEVLDTVCVGDGMTGNEDSDECISNGGQIVKIKNRTTKIKLELIPESETIIDALDQNDLYFNKDVKSKPISKNPTDIANYNKNYNMLPLDANANKIVVPQTTGITYNLGQTSTNTVGNSNSSSSGGFNPQPTNATINSNVTKPTVNINSASASSLASSSASSVSSTLKIHPPLFVDDDEVVRKCTRDAINNATKITMANKTIMKATSNTITNASITNASTTTFANISGNTTMSNTTITILIILILLIVMFIGFIIYKSFSTQTTNS